MYHTATVDPSLVAAAAMTTAPAEVGAPASVPGQAHIVQTAPVLVEAVPAVEGPVAVDTVSATAVPPPAVPPSVAPVAVSAPAAMQQLPPIRRLRVCLLGGDSFVHGVGKTDVAAALLRGLTADQPGPSDPALDLAFDRGVFERAWRELLASEPLPAGGDGGGDGDTGGNGDGGGEGSGTGESNAGTSSSPANTKSDRWGAGPIGAWDAEGRVRFDRRSRGESTPPYDADPAEESASLCAGHSEKLHLGHKRSSGLFRAFREVLGAAGQDVDAFEAVHRELYAAAEASPRELVRRDHPCSGMQAAFARFSPEVGGYLGCGAVILHVFEPGFWPRGSPQNVAMLYMAAPNSRFHIGLNSGALLLALRAAGSNIARAVREYNRHAAAQAAPEGWERAMWLQADLRAQVEYCLSDRNLKVDRAFRDRVAADEDGWLDLDLVKGGYREEELFSALSESKCVDTKVAEDGKVFVRRANGRPVPDVPGMPLPRGSKRKRDEDPTCWDFVAKGSCPRGDKCRYIHAMPGGAAPEPEAQQEAGNGSSPVQAAASAALLAAANLGVVAEGTPPSAGGPPSATLQQQAQQLLQQTVQPQLPPQTQQQPTIPSSAAPVGNGVNAALVADKVAQPLAEETKQLAAQIEGVLEIRAEAKATLAQPAVPALQATAVVAPARDPKTPQEQKVSAAMDDAEGEAMMSARRQRFEGW